VLLARVSDIVTTGQIDIIFDNLRNADRIQLLLFGSPSASNVSNCLIMEATCQFISRSQRFSHFLRDDNDET